MGKIIDIFTNKFSNQILNSHEYRGDETIWVDRAILFEVLQFAKTNSELQFDMLMDVCGVDYFPESPRFEVVYHLYSVPKNHRIRIKVKVSEDDCWVPSCISLWKATDWFERETYEMFGIRFEGHPNLKKLLLFEGFEGYPLRKDYPINKRQKIPEPLETL